MTHKGMWRTYSTRVLMDCRIICPKSLVVAVSLENFKAQLSKSTSTFLAAGSSIQLLILTVNILLATFTLRKI
jgi:hypothetical protein